MAKSYSYCGIALDHHHHHHHFLTPGKVCECITSPPPPTTITTTTITTTTTPHIFGALVFGHQEHKQLLDIPIEGWGQV